MADIRVILYPQEPYHVLFGRRILYNSNGTDAQNLGVQPETNVHFIGKYRPAKYIYLQSQRENAALDLPPAPAPAEARNQAFVILYPQEPYNVVKPGRLFYFQQDDVFQSPPATQPETNPHFVGKFDHGGYVFFSSSEDATVSGVAAQPETNTHFIGRYAVHKYRLPNYFVPDYPFQPPPPVQETNTHFIGKYRQPSYGRPINTWDTGTAGPLAVQPETNVHFIGRYRLAKHLRWQGANLAPALDVRPDIGAPFLDVQETDSGFLELAVAMADTTDVASVAMMSTLDEMAIMSSATIDLQGAFV